MTTASDYKSLLDNTGSLILRERCNCGDQVRHNNGGNYHEIIEITSDSAGYSIRRTDTSDFSKWSEPHIMDENYINKIIRSKMKLGWILKPATA